MSSLIIPPQQLHDEEAAIPDAPSHHDMTVVNSPRSSIGPHVDAEKSLKDASGPHHASNETLQDDVQPDTVRTPGEKEGSFLVDWDGPDDPEDPLNWSRTNRWYLTILASILSWNATFASSSPSGIIPDMMKAFGFSIEVGTLTVSLFVAGYCVGPLLWGPLSEVFGRRPILIITFIVYVGFSVGCALSKNTASILIFRFLAGCFAASPVVLAGALNGDIWDPVTRGSAMSLYTVSSFAGPALGPAVGGFISVSGATWRWLYWVCTICGGVMTVLVIFTLDETYRPVILKRKAIRKRKETGDDRWIAPIEVHKWTFGGRVKEILAKPFVLLFREPMLMAVTIYMSFVYGCLYLLFEAYPIVFGMGHHFNAGISGLMFIPLLLGCVTAVIIYMLWINPRYARSRDAYAPKPVPPEERLPMGAAGGLLFSIGFFWFGWTSFPSISYWAPMLAGGLFGLSITMIFLSFFNYIVDTYLPVAATALAANTVCRSTFGAVFPLFARQMYDSLNPHWASTLIGCVSLLLIPIPVLFIKYGAMLRAKSMYSPTM